MPFNVRQQKLDKLCRGYKTLCPRLTKYCRERVPSVPGGVNAYELSYRRGTARCVVSIEILPIATQQCRNYSYDKS